MPLRNVATTFTIEQQRLEINNLAGDVNNIETGATTVATATTAVNATNATTAATANALAAGATGTDLTLSGTLTVNGTQTILNTETLQVEDKEIVIGNVSSPTDATAHGGGWKLKGANNKTITYNQTGDKWESNKPFEASNLLYNSGNQTITNTGDTVLTVSGPGHSQLSLTNTSGTDHCSINFGDNDDIDAGEIRYTNSNNTLYVETAGQIALSIDSNQVASFVGQINVESQGTYFKSNQLKFNPSGTAYIDHGVTGNDIVFRLSNSNPLDTSTLTLKDNGFAEFTGANDLRVTLGNVGTAGTNDSNWIRGSNNWLMYNGASGGHIWEIAGNECGRLTSTGFELGEGQKTIFNSNSGNGAYIKHQSGHLEIKNETGNCYWDNTGLIRIRTGANIEALSIGSGQDVQIPNGYLQIDPTDHDKLKLKVPSGASDDWAYMTFWGEDGNRNAYIGTNAAGDVKVSRDGGCNLEMGANAVFNANVSDSKGDLRSIPDNVQSSSSNYDLVASDAGKCIIASGNVTFSAGIFSAGDAVTIINNTNGDITIVMNGTALYYTADGTTGNRTLGTRGMASIYFTHNTTGYISGAQLS